MTRPRDEAWVKDRVKDILNARKAYYFMPPASRFGKSGVPDFIVCYKGLFIGIETKARGNVPTELQEEQMRLIRGAGGVSMVIDEHNYVMVAEFLDGLVDSLMVDSPTFAANHGPLKV